MGWGEVDGWHGEWDDFTGHGEWEGSTSPVDSEIPARLAVLTIWHGKSSPWLSIGSTNARIPWIADHMLMSTDLCNAYHMGKASCHKAL